MTIFSLQSIQMTDISISWNFAQGELIEPCHCYNFMPNPQTLFSNWGEIFKQIQMFTTRRNLFSFKLEILQKWFLLVSSKLEHTLQKSGAELESYVICPSNWVRGGSTEQGEATGAEDSLLRCYSGHRVSQPPASFPEMNISNLKQSGQSLLSLTSVRRELSHPLSRGTPYTQHSHIILSLPDHGSHFKLCTDVSAMETHLLPGRFWSMLFYLKAQKNVVSEKLLIIRNSGT